MSSEETIMDALLSALIRASDTLHEGLIITDSELNVLYVNRRSLELLNIAERELKRRPLTWTNREFSRGAESIEQNAPIENQSLHHNESELRVSYFPSMNAVTGECSLCLQLNDLKTYQTLKAKTTQDQFYYDVLDVVMNTINEWVVIVDRNGIITAMSKSYKEFLQDSDPEGKHVSEVIENTRLHLVIETGIAETGEMQLNRGNKMIACRIPIIQDGIIVGAVGKAIFKDIDDFYTLFNKISQLQKKVHFHTEELSSETTARYTFDNIIGDSLSTQSTIKMAQKAARTDSSVLITGESGTGKELFAHAVHNASPRRSRPFIMLNCAAIPSELLESELFGYEQGAFTGANRQGKKGKFELADTGTIFLDEIGDMPLEMQAKLLRVLQEKELDRVGSNAPIRIDVRVIAATNYDIEQRITQGNFRSDLYYRLNVMRLNMTPLRERKEEIPEIADEILRKLTHRMGLIVYGFTPEAIESLKGYDWPGNVRELENILERSLNLLEDDLFIKPSLFPEFIAPGIAPIPVPVSLPASHETARLQDATVSLEIEMILKALKETGGNKKKAATLLGISRAGLYKKLEQHCLTVEV